MHTRIPTTTQDVADALGLTYRQVDFLTRNGTITDPRVCGTGSGSGPGNRRNWPAEIVTRLHVAKAITTAAPWVQFPDAARAVLATDLMPLPRGLVILRPNGTVEYADNPVTLVAALGDGGVVADYELPHAA